MMNPPKRKPPLPKSKDLHKLTHMERLFWMSHDLSSNRIPVKKAVSITDMSLDMAGMLEAIEKTWDDLPLDEMLHPSQDDIGRQFTIEGGSKDDDIDFREIKYFEEKFSQNPAVQEIFEFLLASLQANPGYAVSYGDTVMERAKSILNSQLRIMYHMFMFAMHHERAYKLSDGLFEALMDSDMKSPVGLLRAPHEELLLVLPQSCQRNLPANKKKAESLYVNLKETNMPDYLRLAVLITQRVKSTAEIQDEDVFFFEMFLDKTMDLNESIRTICDKLKVPADHIRDDIAWYTELVCKSLLYITSANTERLEVVPSLPAIETKRNQKYIVREKTRKPFYMMGGDILISHKHDAKQHGTAGTGEGGEHSYRYMVMGHWHSFWILKTNLAEDGQYFAEKGNKVLIRRFVAPFWKGPEFGQQLLKDYKVRR